MSQAEQQVHSLQKELAVLSAQAQAAETMHKTQSQKLENEAANATATLSEMKTELLETKASLSALQLRSEEVAQQTEQQAAQANHELETLRRTCAAQQQELSQACEATVSAQAQAVKAQTEIQRLVALHAQQMQACKAQLEEATKLAEQKHQQQDVSFRVQIHEHRRAQICSALDQALHAVQTASQEDDDQMFVSSPESVLQQAVTAKARLQDLITAFQEFLAGDGTHGMSRTYVCQLCSAR